MPFSTGQTIIEDILSLDADNNPVTATTFDVVTLKDGALYTGLTVSMGIVDYTRGIFYASWSADTIGSYQMYIKNNITNVIFITDPVIIYPDSYFDENIYIGL